jgi:hypothetical protein
LPVSKAGCVVAFESLNYEGLYAGFVDRLVVFVRVKDIVKLEVVLLNELCQINFAPENC